MHLSYHSWDEFYPLGVLQVATMLLKHCEKQLKDLDDMEEVVHFLKAVVCKNTLHPCYCTQKQQPQALLPDPAASVNHIPLFLMGANSCLVGRSKLLSLVTCNVELVQCYNMAYAESLGLCPHGECLSTHFVTPVAGMSVGTGAQLEQGGAARHPD